MGWRFVRLFMMSSDLVGCTILCIVAFGVRDL